jgi:L-iditol 2-dehydrogenase
MVANGRMKALVLKEINSIQLADNKIPDCKGNEALLKVDYCSVCRTDAKMWSQGQRDLVLPRVLGHEICGHLDSGERFIVWPASTCNSCDYCKTGKENLCGNIQVIGFHRDGGFAEYVKVPKVSLIKVPDNVPSEIACMTELLSSAINAVDQIGLVKKQKALIYGGGPAGLLLGLACKHFGADPLVVERNPEKIKVVSRFSEETDIPISGSVNSDCFDAAINAAPDLNAFADGVARLKSGGRFCLFSGFTNKASLSTSLLNEIHYRQLTLVGAYGSTKRQMELALKIFESNPESIRRLIHRIIKLEEVPVVLPEILLGQTLKYIVKMHSDTIW